MEKMIKKMMVAGLACLAMCGTAMAAPKGGNGPHAGRAPEAKRMTHAPSHSYGGASKQNNRPTRQVTRHTAPQPAAHHAPASMQVTHHKRARRPETPCHRHHRHECNDCHYNDNGWIEVGAGIIVTAALAGLAI